MVLEFIFIIIFFMFVVPAAKNFLFYSKRKKRTSKWERHIKDLEKPLSTDKQEKDSS